MVNNCPICNNSEVAHVELSWIYDGTSYYACVNCHHRWHRFPPESKLRAAVEKAWAQLDERSALPPSEGQHD